MSVVAFGVVAFGLAERYDVTPLSETRHLVRGQLANVALQSGAVGTTSAVTGTLLLSETGDVHEGSIITVDLSTLRSNQARRDAFLRRNTPVTERFLTAVFVPTELRGLEQLPSSGAASFETVGELTLCDVTREVVWQAEATFDEEIVELHATASFTFEAFALTQPRVFLVLSIDDALRLDVDLTLEHAPK